MRRVLVARSRLICGDDALLTRALSVIASAARSARPRAGRRAFASVLQDASSRRKKGRVLQVRAGVPEGPMLVGAASGARPDLASHLHHQFNDEQKRSYQCIICESDRGGAVDSIHFRGCRVSRSAAARGSPNGQSQPGGVWQAAAVAHADAAARSTPAPLLRTAGLAVFRGHTHGTPCLRAGKKDEGRRSSPPSRRPPPPSRPSRGRWPRPRRRS